jgi:hypothetical protein
MRQSTLRPILYGLPNSFAGQRGQGRANNRRSRLADATGIVMAVLRFILTLLLVALALAAAAAVAFGTDPALAQRPDGLHWITLTRRLQWPLMSLCLILCVFLIGLVVAGKRRAFWLVALLPVLFFFYQRFADQAYRNMAILDAPTFVAADKATFLKNDSPVVGLIFEETPYAYPVGSLALAPVVVHAESDKRLLLMWSPYGGRARAFVIDHSFKTRELDIVSMPANAMLLYNSRIGQFINAFTGVTLAGERPDGFKAPVETFKTTWKHWRSDHPATKVLASTLSPAGEKLQPIFPTPDADPKIPANTRVTLIDANRPIAIQAERVGGGEPLNLVTGGGLNLLVFRDRAGGKILVFDRAVKGDLFPRFSRKAVGKRPEVALVDADTNSYWTLDGRCVEGYCKGEQLRSLHIEEDISWLTLRTYYPEVELATGPLYVRATR